MTGGAFQPVWTLREHGGARPHAARRALAVPWRHPALILACAVAGAGATAALPQRQAAAPAALTIAAHGHVQPIRPAPDVVASAAVLAGAGGPGLRLDLELGPASAAASGAVVAQGDDAGGVGLDDVDALLKRAPPAAGAFAPRALDGVASTPAARGAGLLPGLLAGLLLGLLVAAARELRGDRMRSVREAEWALGAPVLGAIPTLSARARGALLAPASRRAAADLT